LPAAARAARYRLLAQAARASDATHILTAHTRDDQAETLLMRMLRGSGIAGLAAMARESERDGLVLARPFLDISKSQLIATLRKAKVGFAEDPTNRDTSFTRPRLRTLMPVLAAEGGDTRNLVRLASRLARANAAVEVLVDGAERYLALRDRQALHSGFNAETFDAGRLDAKSFDAKAFAAMPDEIRLRLLQRVIDRIGHEGPAELGKVEALLSALDLAAAENNAGHRPRLKQTLAGALISLIDSRIRIEPAPPRRRSG
jgi:tRNA(Ile)-lysidine synthase